MFMFHVKEKDTGRKIFLTFRRMKKILHIDTGQELPEGKILSDNRVAGKDDVSRGLNIRLESILQTVGRYVNCPDLTTLGNEEIVKIIERRLNHLNDRQTNRRTRKTRQTSKKNVQETDTVEKEITLVELTEKRIAKCGEEGREDAAQRLKRDLVWITKCFKDIPASQVRKKHVLEFQRMLEKQGRTKYFSEQTIVRLKATWHESLQNEWFTFSAPSSPFEGFKAVYRGEPIQLDLTEDEFLSVLSYETGDMKQMFARDMFLLSFYLGGLSIKEIIETDLQGEKIEYLRKANKNLNVAVKTVFDIQPEARPIISRWFMNGALCHPFPMKTNMAALYRYVLQELNILREKLGIENKLEITSARRTFSHFAYKIGVNPNVIKYCIGQSSFTRNVICNYVQVVEQQANEAFRLVIDYALGHKVISRQTGMAAYENLYTQPCFKASFAW